MSRQAKLQQNAAGQVLILANQDDLKYAARAVVMAGYTMHPELEKLWQGGLWFRMVVRANPPLLAKEIQTVLAQNGFDVAVLPE